MAGVDTLFVEMLMGHKIGLKQHYFKPTEQEILEGNDKKRGYPAAITDLTIQTTKEENEKLREQVLQFRQNDSELKIMRSKYEKDMKAVREEMEKKFQQILAKIDNSRLEPIIS